MDHRGVLTLSRRKWCWKSNLQHGYRRVGITFKSRSNRTFYGDGNTLDWWCHALFSNHYQFSSVTVKWSEVAQSCLTLCDPVDCSLPGSSLHGILQARTHWSGFAISFSRGSSWLRNHTRVSRIPGRRFNLWATREARSMSSECLKWGCDWGTQFLLLLFKLILSLNINSHMGLVATVLPYVVS